MAGKKEIRKNYQCWLERKALYKSFGYDIDKERAFVIDKARPLYGNILEVGTGKGYLTAELARHGYKFTSIDISSEDQKTARLNIKYLGFEKLVHFEIEDAGNLSFADASFDTILSVNTLHHLAEPLKVLDELIRVLAKEGKIILSDFTKEGLGLIDKVHASEGRIHPLSNFTLGDIEDSLRQKGFNIKRCRSKFQEVLIAYRPAI